MKDGQWWDKSWNPVQGCSPCSIGCKFCWAKAMANRFNGGDFSIKLYPERLDQPLHWRKPKRIFVCSMSDLFHEKVPFEYIDEVMAIISLCPQHTNLILTKRVKRMLQYFTEDVGMGFNRDSFIEGRAHKILIEKMGVSDYEFHAVHFPLNNVHLGVSISNQDEADEKIPILLQIPAAVRWLSIEPMLGPIELNDTPAGMITGPCDECGETKSNPSCESCMGIPSIDGIIVGCESGPGRRPCNYEWAQSIVNQCDADNVPVFVKQMNINGKVVKMPKEFPQELPERI